MTGCGHGVLNSIYASIEHSSRLKGWDGVDLVIIGGDFQAIRNAYDLNAASLPIKHREMHDFHEYYSGKRAAPYLTLFTGGNHEASNYMFELYYGGWVAPNIYYLGASGVVRLGPLRIAGLSGIWKGYDYNKPHHERLPYNQDDIKTPYHQRELDTRKLLQIRTQVDIGLSHDWPRGIEHHGNKRQLFQFKPHLEPDSQNGTLGSVAAKQVMEHLRPPYWFASHLHCKFAAMHTWDNEAAVNRSAKAEDIGNGSMAPVAKQNQDEIDLEIDEDDVEAGEPTSMPTALEKNEDEIDLDISEDEPSSTAEPQSTRKQSTVSEDLLSQLPESFKQPPKPAHQNLPPHPPSIRSTTTHFLALDKLEPRKRFLQLQSIVPLSLAPLTRPLKLRYDPEWLAITRAFALEGSPLTPLPNRGYEYYYSKIDEAVAWIQQNVVDKGVSLDMPENFERVAPVYDEALGIGLREQPREWPNPQTQTFCELIGAENHFAISEEDIQERMANATVLDYGGGSSRARGRGRGDFRGRGRFQRGGFRGRRSGYRSRG